MDFNQCFSILQTRSDAAVSVERSAQETQALPHSSEASTFGPPAAEPAAEALGTLSTVDLVRRFHELQADRIMTYAYFDNELQDIIAGNCTARYPLICSEVTPKFARLSAAINSVKETFHERGSTELAACIARVQAAEKDKLTLVAAHHLDQLKSTVLQGSEHLTGSKTEAQVKYLAEQIAACQATISEAMEELQCCLCEES